eukprot:Pgem_evm1s10982
MQMQSRQFQQGPPQQFQQRQGQQQQGQRNPQQNQQRGGLPFFNAGQDGLLQGFPNNIGGN